MSCCWLRFLLWKLDEHSRPVGFKRVFLLRLDRSPKDVLFVLLVFRNDKGVCFERDAIAKGRTGAILPRGYWRHENAHNAAGCVLDGNLVSHALPDVTDEVVLLHLVARSTGDTRVHRPHEQRTLTAFEPTLGRGHAHHEIGATSFDSFVPSSVLCPPRGFPTAIVLFVATLGQVWNESPVGIFEVVTDIHESDPGPGHNRLICRRGIREIRDSARDQEHSETSS